jgi:hypothetical protein
MQKITYLWRVVLMEIFPKLLADFVGGENMQRNLISETDSGVSSGALNNQGMIARQLFFVWMSTGTCALKFFI